MNTKDLIADLKSQLQALEDAKSQLTDAQEYIRQMISEIQMAEVNYGG